MAILYLSLFLFFVNLIIFLNFKNLTTKISLFDTPDEKLKKHKKPVSIIGGLIILINLFLIIFFLEILDLDYLMFKGNFSYIIVILGTTFFFIGFIDDLKNLSPNIKLSLLLISIFLITLLFPELKLKNIKISFLEQIYFFNNFSFIFTILSFALLRNAINMFDGINLQLFFLLFCIFNFYIKRFFTNIFYFNFNMSYFFSNIKLS